MPFAQLENTVGATLFYQHHRPATPSTRLPLVFVMGLGADLQAWRPQLEYFRSRREVILFDHAGVGQSPRPRRPRLTIERMADDAEAMMARLGVPVAHWVGISLGGLVLQQMAIRHPARVASLSLAATYARPARHIGPLAAKIVAGVALHLLRTDWRKDPLERTTDALMRTWTPQCFSEEFGKREVELIRSEIRGAVERNGRADVTLAQLAAILRYDARSDLARVNKPAWVLVGEDDRMVPVQRARELAEAIPGARFEVWGGIGHGLTLECATRFNEALERWVDEHEPRMPLHPSYM